MQQAYDPIWMGSFPRAKLQKGREAILEVLQHEKKRFIDEAQRQSVGPPTVSPPVSPRMVPLSPPRSPRNGPSTGGTSLAPPSPRGPALTRPPQSMPNLCGGGGGGTGRSLSPQQAGLPTGTVYVSVPRFLLGDEVAILAGTSGLFMIQEGHSRNCYLLHNRETIDRLGYDGRCCGARA